MSRYVTDTHALYWHLTSSPKLSSTARKIFLQADVGEHQILIPSIILIEMIYLVEKGRIDFFALDRVLKLLDDMEGSYIIAPLDRETVTSVTIVSRDKIPDMPDRIIAATAVQHQLPLITKDSQINASGIVTVIW